MKKYENEKIKSYQLKKYGLYAVASLSILLAGGASFAGTKVSADGATAPGSAAVQTTSSSDVATSSDASGAAPSSSDAPSSAPASLDASAPSSASSGSEASSSSSASSSASVQSSASSSSDTSSSAPASSTNASAPSSASSSVAPASSSSVAPSSASNSTATSSSAVSSATSSLNSSAVNSSLASSIAASMETEVSNEIQEMVNSATKVHVNVSKKLTVQAGSTVDLSKLGITFTVNGKTLSWSQNQSDDSDTYVYIFPLYLADGQKTAVVLNPLDEAGNVYKIPGYPGKLLLIMFPDEDGEELTLLTNQLAGMTMATDGKETAEVGYQAVIPVVNVPQAKMMSMVYKQTPVSMNNVKPVTVNYQQAASQDSSTLPKMGDSVKASALTYSGAILLMISALAAATSQRRRLVEKIAKVFYSK